MKAPHFNTKHGHARIGKATRTYRSWQRMMARCYNPNQTYFERYGGRGIRVCKRWHKFENFLKDMGVRPPNRSIDRKNNDGNYTKRNCKWSTRKEQARNSPVTKYLTHKGIRLSREDWARKLGLAKHAIYDRLQAGWSVRRALSTFNRRK